MYHRRRMGDGRPGATLSEAQLAAWKHALEGMDGSGGFMKDYRATRMDFGLYEREVLLSPFDDTGAALAEIFPALLARKKELSDAIDQAARGQHPATGDATAVLALAKKSAEGLGMKFEDQDAWGAGDLGQPEKGAVVDGHFTSTIGATFDVSGSWTPDDLAANPFDMPLIRFSAFHKADAANPSVQFARFELRVREFPGTADFGDLEAFVEMTTWEELGNNSWKKMESSKEDRCVRMMGRILSRGNPARLLVIDRVPQAGKRLIELRIQCPEDAWDKTKDEIEALAKSFQLTEKK
jgi:hypothetical protein